MAKYQEQFDRGMELMTRMGRPHGMQNFKEMFPDLYEMTVGHLFGDVWTRPHLSLRDRELITIAVNMALGRPTGNIPHFRSARHIGISKEEILELIMHVGMYAGWGTMGFALDQFTEVLKERAAAEQAKKLLVFSF